jgi:PelA/Pel-15E family pectate lyase
MRPIRASLLTLVAILAAAPIAAAKTPNWKGYERKPDDWYRSAEGGQVAAKILSHQSPLGSWPKNIDTTEQPFNGDRATIQGTFDNGATTGEVRFLARACRVTATPEYRDSVNRALDHIQKAQYQNGGWPQLSPPGKQYHRHITFNDNTMVRLLELLRAVATSDDFSFVDSDRRSAAQKAFDAGLACILNCQVVVDGKKTVWCAQHDEVTLEPRPARTFEPISLSGGESAGILTLLMSLERPSPAVIAAIEAGAHWYDEVKLTGIRQTLVNGDKVVVSDKTAPPLWARFYEIGSNRPMFCGRDGVVKSSIAEIEPERRNGYAWYGNWGTGVAERYARWKASLAKAKE